MIRILSVAVLVLAGACAPTTGSPRPPGTMESADGRDHLIDDGARTMSEEQESSSGGPPASMQPPPEPADPVIALEAAPSYVLGFPIVVSVTYENRTTQAMPGLPDLVPWAVVNPRVGYRLVPVSGGPAFEDRPARPVHGRGPEIAVGPHESRRVLLDLSNYHMTAGPGVYRLSVLVERWRRSIESSAATVELKAPSAADAGESARLRALASPVRPDSSHAWRAFLAGYWETPSISPALGAEAREQLALHLFLHRAFYGPEGLAQLDPARLGAVTSPHLQAEVAALRLEIATARRDPDAPRLAAALLARWPGMRHRVVAVDAGNGFLTEARGFLGGKSAASGKAPYVP
jgi:hypothetical protein